MHLISVITPVHNSERFVGDCIDSVLAQSYDEWEQIIVDDGSTDRTAEAVAGFNDPRIKYIRLPHRGISALAETYNVALSAARGSLVAVLEGDDFWPQDKLALQVPTFDDSEVQISWGDAIIADSNGRPVRAWPRSAARATEVGLDVLFKELTCANILTPTVTVMVRRSALDAVGGFQQPAGALFVDLPTWLKIAIHVSGKARRIRKLLGYYRVHSEQISSLNYDAYQTAQARIVAATIGECSRDALLRVGWDDVARRRSHVRSELATGVALLKRGRLREARRALLPALAHPDSARTFTRAALGVLSTLVSVDLVGVADAARRLSSALALKLSR
ncbi:MAG TPA: glycosyltransferase family 2 protein [Gemmatimonadaceae bacterium]|nr:glycosyltransferase family 2 protein [Gemmatimonadaceae bacterium]